MDIAIECSAVDQSCLHQGSLAAWAEAFQVAEWGVDSQAAAEAVRYHSHCAILTDPQGPCYVTSALPEICSVHQHSFSLANLQMRAVRKSGCRR